MEITKLDIDSLCFPVGIDDGEPVFHYQTALTEDAPEEFEITGHRIRVTQGRKRVWDSEIQPFEGKKEMIYGGPQLAPKTRYDVWASIYNEAGEEIEIDRPVPFETGFLGTEWQAKWICPMEEEGTCWQLHKRFEIEKDIKSTRIYVSAHGLYEIECNHQEVSSLRMTPYMEVSEKQNQSSDQMCYQTYPATGIVRKGENNLIVTLFKENTSQVPALLLQIEIEYRDGSREVIVSDDSFGARASYISGVTGTTNTAGMIGTENTVMGECWDMEKKKELDRYRSEEKYPWGSCRILEGHEKLIAPASDGIRVLKEVSAKGILETPEKQNVIDFGEVLTGGVRFALRGRKGQTAVFRYAKNLDEKGNFPEEEERDILNCEDGYQVFEPRFACRECRYVLVEGVGDEQLAAAEGLVYI